MKSDVASPSATGQKHPPAPGGRLLDNWLAIQAINLDRQARSLRAFGDTEFGTGPASPSPAQIDAVNTFVATLRAGAIAAADQVTATVEAARRTPGPATLQRALARKDAALSRVLYVEAIWDFYHDIFVQRLSSFGPPLRAVDRIGADCYEAIYPPLGRPVPPLLPFSFADAGFSPATFRRGVPLTRLRQHPNLFPLVTIPQHRLSNVWALSSVLHEISHNLQADLGLWNIMPELLRHRMSAESIPVGVAALFARWHKEIAADLYALLLGGPAVVSSLMDVVGRSADVTVTFDPTSVHPTPYLRPYLSTHLLRRLGLPVLAGELEGVWQRLYPAGHTELPPELRAAFPRATEIVVETMVFQPHVQHGGAAMADLLPFGPQQQEAVEEGGRALAAGREPDALAPRFLISAARHAIDQRLAEPQHITDMFYTALGRR